MSPKTLLQIDGVKAGYGEISVLWGIDMALRQGVITALIGSNGAGKSTLMRVLSGLLPLAADQTPAEVLKHGIAHVPEGRRLFGAMSVEDNLLMGAYARLAGKAEIQRDMDRVYATFPKLFERRSQAAGTLSGGEQQMLAIGRALMSRPKLLLLDEPSMGLAPLLVQKIFETIRVIAAEGVTILLVEQNAKLALEICNRGYVMESGEITLHDDAPALLANPQVRRAYLGE